MQHDTPATEPTTAPPSGARPPRVPLGVGGLVTDSFAVFFSHIVMICLIGLVPMLVGQVIPGLVIGLAVNSTDPLGSGSITTSVVMGFLLLCVYTVSTALVIQLTHDEQRGRRIRVRSYLGPAVRALPVLLALSVAIFLILVVAQFGLMLFAAATPYLLIVGLPLFLGFVLWVLASCSICAPAVLLEQAGLHGLGRSFELTREYRWPVAGTLVLTCLLILVFYLIVGALIVVFTMATNALFGALLFGLLSTAGTNILVIAVTLIYTRLREIKEGIGLDQVAEVFE